LSIFNRNKQDKTLEDKYIRIAQVIVVAAGVVGLFAGLAIYYFSDLKEKRKDKETALSGRIDPNPKVESYKYPTDIPAFDYEPALVFIGNNKFTYPKDMLKRDFYPFSFLILNGQTLEIPLSLKIVDGKLLVSASVFDETGKFVCKIVDNEWIVNQNNYFERNYDDNGVEVIDQKGNVVLSADLIQPYTLELNGIFRSSTKEQIVFASKKNGMNIYLLDKVSAMNRREITGKSEKQEYDDEAKKIERKFVFSSKDCLGRRL